MISNGTGSPLTFVNGSRGNAKIVFSRSATTSTSSTTTGASAADVFLRGGVLASAGGYAASPAATSRAATTTATNQSAAVATAVSGSDPKDYDAILANLRKEYDEPTAMKLFDDIMRADGYERVVTDSGSRPALAGGTSRNVEGLANHPLSGLMSGLDDELLVEIFSRSSGDYGSFCTYSTVRSVIVDGKGEIAAEMWEMFGARRPYSAELQDYWQGRHIDEARSTAGFDIDAYMDKLPQSPQRSVAAVSQDLGSLVSDIFARNGVALDAGEYIEFELSDEFGVLVKTDSSHDLYTLFNSDPAFKAALEAQAKTPPRENVSQLPGQYEDADSSVTYSSSRYFTYRADEPSAVVMNDFLGVEGTGYTYAKKAGDYFDPNADRFTAMLCNPVDVMILSGDREGMAGRSAQLASTLQDFVRGAFESDTITNGTVPYETVNDVMAAVLASNEEWYASLPPMYDAGEPEDSHPAASRNDDDDAQGKDVVESLSSPAEETSRYESIQQGRREALHMVVERLRAQYAKILR